MEYLKMQGYVTSYYVSVLLTSNPESQLVKNYEEWNTPN